MGGGRRPAFHTSPASRLPPCCCSQSQTAAPAFCCSCLLLLQPPSTHLQCSSVHVPLSSPATPGAACSGACSALALADSHWLSAVACRLPESVSIMECCTFTRNKYMLLYRVLHTVLWVLFSATTTTACHSLARSLVHFSPSIITHHTGLRQGYDRITAFVGSSPTAATVGLH